MKPFRLLAEATTTEGRHLKLHEHDGDYYILLNGQQLMSSRTSASEIELARVAWDWLAYPKRQGDGIVLPVTFDSARRLGPYWSATATLEEGDGTQRVLSIVSRSEPSAVAGDRLLVTGLVLGDGVIWAADWHPTAGGAAEPAADPEPAFPAAPF